MELYNYEEDKSFYNYHYNVVSGDNDGFVFTFKDENGNIIDLTDYKFYLTVKKELDDDSTDGNALIVKEVVGDSSGVVSLLWNGSETQNVSGKYYFDVQQKSPDGKITTVITGTLTFISDVTNRTN